MTAATTAANYWRTNIMRKKNAPQVLLLSTFVLFLSAWAGAQSTQAAVAPSAGVASNDRSEAPPAPVRTGPGPNVPTVTAANFGSPTAAAGVAPVTAGVTGWLAPPPSPSSPSQASETAPAKKE